MIKDVKYYLSKGFDQKSAEYYASGRRKIVGVVPRDDFTLAISFDNGEKRLYDMKPFLKKGTVFEPLIDKSVFKRVYLDDDSTLSWDINPNIDSKKVWSNKIDLDPDGCYLDSTPTA